MESESERHAAEMLPGRVVNRLIHRELQEERAWPSEDGRKTPRPPVPTVLVMFIHEIISELGVVVDDALEKRLKVFRINTVCAISQVSKHVQQLNRIFISSDREINSLSFSGQVQRPSMEKEEDGRNRDVSSAQEGAEESLRAGNEAEDCKAPSNADRACLPQR